MFGPLSCMHTRKTNILWRIQNFRWNVGQWKSQPEKAENFPQCESSKDGVTSKCKKIDYSNQFHPVH